MRYDFQGNLDERPYKNILVSIEYKELSIFSIRRKSVFGVFHELLND
jgi:hypothetical protein